MGAFERAIDTLTSTDTVVVVGMVLALLFLPPFRRTGQGRDRATNVIVWCLSAVSATAFAGLAVVNLELDRRVLAALCACLALIQGVCAVQAFLQARIQFGIRHVLVIMLAVSLVCTAGRMLGMHLLWLVVLSCWAAILVLAVITRNPRE